MKTYLHSQPAGRWLAIPLAVAGFLTVVAWGSGFWGLLAGVPVPVGLAWIFRSLSVEVTGDELRWHFGPGLLRKRIPLAEVAAVEAVRTTWLDGWGIHLTRWGWLYNIAGHEAVAIRLKSGRRLALGTDDPAGLVAALGSRLVRA